MHGAPALTLCKLPILYHRGFIHLVLPEPGRNRQSHLLWAELAHREPQQQREQQVPCTATYWKYWSAPMGDEGFITFTGPQTRCF